MEGDYTVATLSKEKRIVEPVLRPTRITHCIHIALSSHIIKPVEEAKMRYHPEERQQQQSRKPTCPLCGGDQFRKEAGRLDSKWGFTSHKLILLICERCQFVLHFYDGHSIFDFD
jgi:uncharacterized protein